MSFNISEWLDSQNRLPENLYELLGVPLFEPDYQALQQAIRDAHRSLHSYQTHSDVKVYKQALALQMELARASATLDDPAELRECHERMLESLRKRWEERTNDRNSFPTLTLTSWLSQQSIHRDWLDFVGCAARCEDMQSRFDMPLVPSQFLPAVTLEPERSISGIVWSPDGTRLGGLVIRLEPLGLHHPIRNRVCRRDS